MGSRAASGGPAGQARAMDEFVSTYTNRLDAKGRVSIPAQFRAVLAVDGLDGLYCCPTLDRQAIDAGGNRLRDTIRASLSNFEPFSEDHELLSTSLVGDSEILKIDQDGRVVLTDAIKSHAGIGERVTFVGQGYKFQLWEPERFAAYREEARARLRDLRKRLSPGRRASGAFEGVGE
jgi:MraZ protein